MNSKKTSILKSLLIKNSLNKKENITGNCEINGKTDKIEEKSIYTRMENMLSSLNLVIMSFGCKL